MIWTDGWPCILQVVSALKGLYEVGLVVRLPVEVRGQLRHGRLGGVFQIPGVTGVIPVTNGAAKTYKDGEM